MSTTKNLPLSSMEAKLNPPDPSLAEVPRRRLTDLLRASRGSRLVVIRAPAGFGKTSLMQQYKHALDFDKVRTAWVTLDRADNDITRFLQCVASAVARMLDTPTSTKTDSTALLALFAQLWQFEGPFVLFLDEYEVIQEEGVQDLVKQIIDSMPRNSQVVIGSRSLLSLALGRLRARGQLLEIDADRLRFTFEESCEYLTVKRGLELAADDVQRLHGKTEGWIAGLWLASAALARIGTKSDFVSRFSGSNLEVAEYLSEDVLNMQAPEVREFLLRTSILRNISPPLCQYLVPEVDADAVLRKLESDNVLITRISDTVLYGTGVIFNPALAAKRFGIQTLLVDNYSDITDILKKIEALYRKRTVFFSGSAEEYGAWSRRDALDFVHDVAANCVKANCRVVNGFGWGVGSAVINGALEAIYEDPQKYSEAQLIVRPFPQHGDNLKDLWEQYRQRMISLAGVALFFFGNKLEDGNLVNAGGCRREFEIALEHGLLPIPVAATGFMAEELWKEISADLEKYYGNFKWVIPMVEKLVDPKVDHKEAVKTITEIIKQLNK